MTLGERERGAAKLGEIREWKNQIESEGSQVALVRTHCEDGRRE